MITDRLSSDVRLFVIGRRQRWLRCRATATQRRPPSAPAAEPSPAEPPLLSATAARDNVVRLASHGCLVVRLFASLSPSLSLSLSLSLSPSVYLVRERGHVSRLLIACPAANASDVVVDDDDDEISTYSSTMDDVMPLLIRALYLHRGIHTCTCTLYVTCLLITTKRRFSIHRFFSGLRWLHWSSKFVGRWPHLSSSYTSE